jgi:hypothetical protein
VTNSRNTTLSLVTVVGVVFLTGMATRAIEEFIVRWVNLTDVAGGGLVSPADTRSITTAMLKLIIPGVLIQAVLIKGLLQSLTTVRVPLIATTLTLFLFEVGAIALQQVIAHEFAKAQGLGALTTYTPWTLFFSVGMTVAILIFEGVLIRGVSRPRVGRYPVVTYVS